MCCPSSPSHLRHHVTTTQRLTGAAEGADDDDRTPRKPPLQHWTSLAIEAVTRPQAKTSLRNHVLPLFPFAPAAPRHHDTTPHWCSRRRRRRRPNPAKATPPTLDVSRDRSRNATPSYTSQHTIANKHNNDDRTPQSYPTNIGRPFLAIEAITRPQATHRNTRTNTKKPKPAKPRAAAQAPLSSGYQIPFRVWCNQSSQKEVNSPNRNHKPPRTKRQGGAHVN
jgi:hypothetical protein